VPSEVTDYRAELSLAPLRQPEVSEGADWPDRVVDMLRSASTCVCTPGQWAGGGCADRLHARPDS